jgi:hypothetical protein
VGRQPILALANMTSQRRVQAASGLDAHVSAPCLPARAFFLAHRVIVAAVIGKRRPAMPWQDMSEKITSTH